ncbi:MAG: carbonic anhydrase [Alphaproteobacteria bacterium]|nr:carbonic anhydrase [Alphaproteobacteria bacterium]
MPIHGLIAGFESFRALNYRKRRGGVLTKLAREGQHPKILLIACSDARVDPAILFNADPGEMFVIRNVAAMAPPYHPDGETFGVSAAIEYAVRDLEVEHIVVLGHSHCGGIGALAAMEMGQELDREFIGPWMQLAHEALAANPKGCSAQMNEQAVVRYSLRNLMTFPWLRERVEQRRLELHGWWFDMDNGRLMRDTVGEADFTELA